MKILDVDEGMQSKRTTQNQNISNLAHQLGQFGNGLSRQSDQGPSVSTEPENSSNDEVRCIPKVMQVRNEDVTT